MVSTTFPDLLHRTAESFSLTEEAVLAAGVVLAGMILFAVAVLLHVVLHSRERETTWSLKSVVTHAIAALWAVPVLAVPALFTYRVMENARPNTEPAEVTSSAYASEGDVRVPVSFCPAQPAPEWVNEPRKRDASRRLVSLVIKTRGANVAEAERKLAAVTRRVLHREYPDEFPHSVASRLSRADIKRRLLAKPPAVQKGLETVGTYENDARQVYWKLDLSPPNRAAVRQTAVRSRLWVLAGGMGLLVLVVAAATFYFRLDAATQGAYRLRLKLAMTSLVVAVGLLITALLPMA